MTLVCIECGETSEDGESWKAELAAKLVDRYEVDVQGPRINASLAALVPPEVLVAGVQ